MRPPTRRSFLATCGAVGLSGLAGCAAPTTLTDEVVPHRHQSDAVLTGGPDPTWPTLGYDNRRSGTKPDDTGPTTGGTLRRLGLAGTDSNPPAPVVAGDTVLVCCRLLPDGSDERFSGIVAYERTGSERWRLPTDRLDMSMPTVVGQTAFVETGRATRAVDLRTGDLRWRYATGYGFPWVAPAVADGRVFVSGRRLYALDAATGEPIWRHEPKTRGAHSVTVAEGTVFLTNSVGPNEPGLLAFDAETGEPRWTVDVAPVEPSPVVVDGRCFVVDERGVLTAVTVDDGTVVWERDDVAPVRAEHLPVVAGDSVYLAARETATLVALSAATGETQWVSDPEVRSDFTPAVAGDTLYAAARHPAKLFALDRSTGESRWRWSAESDDQWLRSTPVVGDGRLYVRGETWLRSSFGQLKGSHGSLSVFA